MSNKLSNDLRVFSEELYAYTHFKDTLSEEGANKLRHNMTMDIKQLQEELEELHTQLTIETVNS